MLCCCSRREQQHSIDGFALGTTYHIAYQSADSLDLRPAIDSLFEAVDGSMSIFNPTSRLNRLNRGQTDTLDAWITRCITTAHRISTLSSGAYDITALPLIEAWGFATEQQIAEPNLDSLLQFVGYQKIRIEGDRLVKADSRVRIDLNSIAKGYCVDLLAELLAGRGLTDFLVEVGGEISVRGTNARGEPWRVGIDRPEEGNFVPGAQTQSVIGLSDQCLATSGNYRNFHYDASGRKVVHTIDPRTGASTPSDLLSATVIAPTCAEADALCTALVALGVEESVRLVDSLGLQAYLIYEDAAGNFAAHSTL